MLLPIMLFVLFNPVPEDPTTTTIPTTTISATDAPCWDKYPCPLPKVEPHVEQVQQNLLDPEQEIHIPTPSPMRESRHRPIPTPIPTPTTTTAQATPPTLTEDGKDEILSSTGAPLE